MTAPTMRNISGASAATMLDAAATALIVIDFQLEYFNGKLRIPDGAAAMAQANRLIAFADANRMPVFHIQHMNPAGGALFAKDGEQAAIHPGIAPAAHHMLVQKTMASSFAGTDLHECLQARGIATLIICGLMTHMCVSTAARDARPRGYQVVVAADACATRDIDAWDGGVLAHADLHRAALTAVSDGFGEVMPTAQVTALAIRQTSN
ncbi:MAG: cysteine hydrolase [Herminiimonas sp.]|nr:cysteine hydrolase [Herminiimonas sp.]